MSATMMMKKTMAFVFFRLSSSSCPSYSFDYLFDVRITPRVPEMINAIAGKSYFRVKLSFKTTIERIRLMRMAMVQLADSRVMSQ